MIVIDTHVVIWDALEPKRLSPKAKRILSEAEEKGGIYLCEMSLWEIAMAISKGRLNPGIDFQSFIRLVLSSRKYILQGIDVEIAELSTTLPLEGNADPVDRIIAATSLIKKAPLVTADRNLLRASCLQAIW